MIDRQLMINQLVLHEGLKLVPYLDTEGNTTVGVGYNVTSRGWDDWDQVTGNADHQGVLREDALKVLAFDIDRVEKVIPHYWPGYVNVDPVRQRVVVDMAFNMGFRALGFKNCIAAIERKDWSRAARELYNSKWGVQVGEAKGQRCDRLARMLLTGLNPTDVPLAA